MPRPEFQSSAFAGCGYNMNSFNIFNVDISKSDLRSRDRTPVINRKVNFSEVSIKKPEMNRRNKQYARCNMNSSQMQQKRYSVEHSPIGVIGSPMMRNNAEQAVRVNRLKFILQGQDFSGQFSPHLNTSNPTNSFLDDVDMQIKRNISSQHQNISTVRHRASENCSKLTERVIQQNLLIRASPTRKTQQQQPGAVFRIKP